MNRIKDMKVLKRLREEFEVEFVKYDVLTKTFLYKFPHEEVEKNITFDTLINTMNEERDIHVTLLELKRAYFPRRLKETIGAFYENNNLEVPKELFITEKGFELQKDGELIYVEYHDEFEIFLKEFAKLYGVKDPNFKVIPNVRDYEGHYH